MKTVWTAIIAGLIVAAMAFSSLGAETKSTRDFKIVGRDYNFWDDIISVHPVSIGVASWTDENLGNRPALYASGAMFTYKDVVRLEFGGVVTWDNNRGWADIAMLTGVSTLINDHIIFGIWLSPFWNLYGDNPDDPWGVMLGYAF